MDDQLQLTDLIPRRLSGLLGLFLVGVGLIAAIELAHLWVPTLSHYSTSGKVPAFDLAGDGSLAVWLTSMWLALASLLSLVVYTVRRHRCDDYAGHYRIWLWGASCWAILSLDRTANLHECFRDVMVFLTGTRLYGDGTAWWAIPYVFLIGAVGLRLLLDMRECWLSSIALAAAALTFALSVATPLGWLARLPAGLAPLVEGETRLVLIEQGARLSATLLLVFALALQARFVILDAEGLIPRRRVRVRTMRRSAARASDLVPAMVAVDDAGQSPVFVETAIDPAHAIHTPMMTAGQTLVTTPVAITNAAGPRKLSKAEKKALRKRLDQMRSQRERGW